MNLFGFHITRSQTAPPASTRSLPVDPQAWLSGAEYRAPYESLANAYEQVVWVYRAVTALAEQVANVPFLFSRGVRGRENLITSGPLIDFYNHPHPRLNRFQYWELRVLWLMLRGECFRLPIFRNNHGELSLATGVPLDSPPPNSVFGHQPKSSAPPRRTESLEKILFLDPERCKPVIRGGILAGWRYEDHSPNAELPSQTLLPEELWFDRLPNPFDPWRGLAPLYLADTPAKNDFTASSFMRGIMANNAENGFIVRTEQQLSDEQREQIVSALRRRKRSAGSPDQTIVLWGATEIVQPKISSVDLQFLENRKFSRAEICAAFGVPEEIVTTTDHNKYDVMHGARLNFIENRVGTLCARLEAEEQPTVSAIDPNAVGWFDLDSLPIMQEARRARLATAKIGFDMGIPFNDLNRIFDLGFPSLPWGNTGYLTSNLTPLTPGESSNPSSK